MTSAERGRAAGERAGGRLRVVFFGSSAFAEPALRALDERHRVAAVVTQPDRPAGRGRRLRETRIRRVARGLGLPVLDPARVRRRSEWQRVAALQPDCLVVADYGQILPAGLLAVPPLGAVNVHASLLPELRGAAPAVWAIARGLHRTGVTTMLMDAGLDTGPVLLQRETPIRLDDTSGSLLARLAPAGAELLIETLAGLAEGTIEPRPQDDGAASLAPRVRKADAALDWTSEAAVLAARIRAFSPAPTAFTAFSPRAGGEPSLLKVHAATVGEPAAGAAPGSFRVDGSLRSPRLVIVCGNGTTLLPGRVQAAGRRPVGIADFLRGNEPARFLGAEEVLRAANP